MIDKSELIILLSEAINAAVRAGKLIIDVYNSNDFQVNLKSDSTPLTLADKLAHEEISKSLSKTRIPLLSEEGRNLHYEERKGWEIFWLVDPLDGTKEFIKRNGEFTVNIALILNNYPILGVVYVPVTGDLYFSLESIGSFKIKLIDPYKKISYNFEDLVLTSEKLPIVTSRSKFTVVGSRSHMSPDTQQYIEKLRAKYGDLDFKSRGSSLKICMVAEGQADIYPRFGTTTEWDTAAGQAIAEGAGCQVISADLCKRIAYNKEELDNPWFIVRAKPDIGV